MAEWANHMSINVVASTFEFVGCVLADIPTTIFVTAQYCSCVMVSIISFTGTNAGFQACAIHGPIHATILASISSTVAVVPP